MDEAKKSTATTPAAPIADVAPPGQSAPADNSRSLVINRPILKDPMMAEGKPVKSPPRKPPGKVSINQPPPATVPQKDLTEAVDAVADDTVVATDNSAPTVGDDSSAATDDSTSAVEKKPNQPGSDAEQAHQDERTAEIEKMIDSKQYFLPIHTIEQRRNNRMIILAAAAVFILGLGWIDIALDAGIITVSGIKAPTHFFSTSAESPPIPKPTPVTTANPTNQLAIYTSPTDGASFQYPKTWKLFKIDGFTEAVSVQPQEAALNGEKGIFAVGYTRNGAAGDTEIPDTTYTIADVSYQKLPSKAAKTQLYLQQVILKQQGASSTRYISFVSLSSTNTLKIGETVANPSVTNQPIMTNNGKDRLVFVGALTPSAYDSTGKPIPASLEAAQNFLKSSSIAKQTKAILLSFKATK